MKLDFVADLIYLNITPSISSYIPSSISMMRYAIVNGTTIVDTTDNEYGAINYATKTNPGATHLPFVTQEEVLMDPQYGVGHYIVENVRTANLLEKSLVVNPGRLYNSEAFAVNQIDSWTIMSVADDVQTLQNPSDTSIQVDDAKKSSTKSIQPSKVSTGVTDKTKIITTKISEVEPKNDQKDGPNDDKKVAQKVTPSVEPIPVTKFFNAKPVPAPPPKIPPTINTPVNNKNDTQVTTVPVTVAPVTTVPVTVPQKQVIPTLSLGDISAFPSVMSIGNVNKNHRDKIEMIIYNNFAIGALKEENIVVMTNGDPKLAESWTKKFPTCFIYDRLDTDILYHLNPVSRFNKDPISKLVIFDQCLTGEFIQKKQFNSFLDNSRTNHIGIIIMTKDSDVICSTTITSKLLYTLLHTFTVDWTEKVSTHFLAQHPVIGSQKDLQNQIVSCARLNNCLAFYRNSPNTVLQF